MGAREVVGSLTDSDRGKTELLDLVYVLKTM